MNFYQANEPLQQACSQDFWRGGGGGVFFVDCGPRPNASVKNWTFFGPTGLFKNTRCILTYEVHSYDISLSSTVLVRISGTCVHAVCVCQLIRWWRFIIQAVTVRTTRQGSMCVILSSAQFSAQCHGHVIVVTNEQCVGTSKTKTAKVIWQKTTTRKYVLLKLPTTSV